MKGLQLSNFKKIHEDIHTATLQHPEGHKIQISKANLSPKLKTDLEKLPKHMADGGETDEGVVAAPVETVGPTGPIDSGGEQSQMPPDQGQMDLSSNPPEQDNAEARSPASAVAGPKNYVIPSAQQNRMPNQSAAPQQGLNANTLQQMQGGFGLQEKGIRQGIAAQQAEGALEAKAAETYGNDLQKVHETYQQQLAANNQEIQNTLKDIQNGHIDPDHYINNKSTLGKVSTAIGLILGGIGGGILHQENPAAKFLNENINRDIQSQMADLGKKENMLSAYFKQTGNIRDAMAMTKGFYTDLYSNQIRQAMAASKSPMAMANGNQMIGQLQREKAQALQPMAMRNAILSNLNNANIDPAIAVPALVPEHHQKDVFKEISNAQNASRNSDAIMKNFDEAAQQNTIARTGFGLLRTPPSVLSMRAMMLPIIHDAEGRVNEFEQKTTSDLEPKPGDTDAKIAEKRQAMLGFLKGKMAAPTAKAYGIDLNKFQSTNFNRASVAPNQNRNIPGYVKR